MIHKPKTVNTQEGCALPSATKKYKKFANGDIILTEVWNAMSEDWKEGSTIIARPGYKWVSKWQLGKPYVIVKFYNDNDDLIGTYCDVCHPITKNKDGLEYKDLYLDVWCINGQVEPKILDEDELQEALENNYVSEKDVQFAYNVAKELIDKIKNKSLELQF